MLRGFGSIATVAVILFCAPLALHAQTVVDNTSRTYVVKYSDGGQDTILVEYKAILDANQWQTGSVSVINVKHIHPIDTTACHWDIKGYIQRQPYFVSHGGERAPIEGQPATQVWNVHIQGGVGPTSSIELFYSKPCSEARNQYDGRVDAAKNDIVRAFPDIVTKDAEQVRKDLAAKLQVVNVNDIQTAHD
jgi:hypothetical protein